MAVPNNPKMSDIQTEFGGSNPIQLSEYYRGGSNVPSNVTSPNGPIATSGTITMGSFRSAAAITVVSLDYLGFGLQPPTPSWGELFSQGAANLQYWHLVVLSHITYHQYI